jgi:OmpA-OmpF porin, OOP family
VLTWLKGHGIEGARLESKGFGESKPIADNNTPEGKEQNRRVEFLIVEQEGVK